MYFQFYLCNIFCYQSFESIIWIVLLDFVSTTFVIKILIKGLHIFDTLTTLMQLCIHFVLVIIRIFFYWQTIVLFYFSYLVTDFLFISTLTISLTATGSTFIVLSFSSVLYIITTLIIETHYTIDHPSDEENLNGQLWLANPEILLEVWSDIEGLRDQRGI